MAGSTVGDVQYRRLYPGAGKAMQGATATDHVVIRMRRDHQHMPARAYPSGRGP
ncbi:MAG TPA: hypothetical protein VGF98_02035 [Candidatus Tumulicola sp.]